MTNCRPLIRPLLVLFGLTCVTKAMVMSSRASRFMHSMSFQIRKRQSTAASSASNIRCYSSTSPSASFLKRSVITMMPEGPEVRTVVNQLQGAVGRSLEAVEFLSGRYSFRNLPVGYQAFQPALQSNAVVQEWNCKGKFIYIIFQDGAENKAIDDDYQPSIWITLGMTGRFVNEQTHDNDTTNKHHARWCLVLVSQDDKTTKRVYYYDPRSFGTLKFCLSKLELESKLQSLGPDILQPTTTLVDFYQAITSSSRTMNICKFLMNQAKISGVGNYILAEALYRSKIDPFCTLAEVLLADSDEQQPVRYQKLFDALQLVARESYQSQQLVEGGGYKTAHFEMHCYGRVTCIHGQKVFQQVNGPHGRTIWYTQQQLFMPLEERLRIESGGGNSKDAGGDNGNAHAPDQKDENVSDGGSAGDRLLQSLLDPGWKTSLAHATQAQSFIDLAVFLAKEERSGATVYPPQNEIFTALNLCPLDKVKVVIIGQDPFHGRGQAHGLSFSVKRGVRPPPSLKNIIREAMEDVGIPEPSHGNLEHWAEQGVLLLNTVLTVRSGEANSHSNKGWEEFTDACITVVNERRSGVVFMLWGNPAAKKASIVDPQRHTLIKTSHPSPLGATKTASPFLGSRCFSRANDALRKQGIEPIDWQIL